MHIISEFELQNIADKNFLFLRKEGEVDFTRIMSFNASSAWLWNQLYGREFSKEEALALLQEHYEGDARQMEENLDRWIDSLVEKGVIEP